MSKLRPKFLINCLRWVAMSLLFPLEIILRSHYSKKVSPPPVFIIGPPRSGTTLLYQLMTICYRFSYFSNFVHRLYKTPTAAYWLSHSFKSKNVEQLESSFGTTKGWLAPNEGGWIWNQYWSDNEWKSEKDIDGIPIVKLRSLISAMSSIGNAPFINKNVMHSNKIRRLNHIFPNCIFIQITRDTLDNARSIIQAQHNAGGPTTGDGNWWSVQPKESHQYFDSGIASKAIYQIKGVERDIAVDSLHIGINRLHTLNYQDLCLSPETELMKIKSFLLSHKLKIEDKGSIPNQLSPRKSSELDTNTEQQLVEALREINLT